MTDPSPGEPAPSRTNSLRETYRKQMLDSIGGWTGALITAVPTAVFVIVNVTTDLRVAIIAAVASALVLAAYRFARKQPVQQALSGLLGVAVAAIIAARTGQARGYFLLGIWTSFAYAVPLAVSLVVRRPLVGVLWEFLDPTPTPGDGIGDGARDASAEPPWYRRRPLLVAYSWATLAATVVFLARGIVQLALYGANRTGWLAFARIAMGYPLFVAAAGLSFLVITRARRRIQAAGA
jgi:type II secretory pathway pseudopilin PulG